MARTVVGSPDVAVAARALGGERAQLRRVALAGVALAVLGVCAFLHLYRLDQAPGWDPQEGYNLAIASSLARGELRLFALRSAFAQHPPLFYLQLLLFIRIFGYGIAALRLLAAFYAVLTCATLLVVGRRLLGIGPALWAAVAYSVAPVILANTRWGYTYVQLAFFGLLCLGAAWEYKRTGRRGWLMAASALAGIATFSDYVGIVWVLFVALLALHRGWRNAALSLGMGLGIPLVGLLCCLALAPSVFLTDFGDTFGRAAGGNPLVQLIVLLANYTRFVALDAWLLLGVVGLFLAPSRARGFLLGAAAILGLAVLKVREVGLSVHTVVPLLPVLALGLGVALDLGLRSLYGWSLAWLTRLLALALPRLASLRSGHRSGSEEPEHGPRRPNSRGGHAGTSVPIAVHRHFAAATAATAATRSSWAIRLPRLGAALLVFLVIVAPVGLTLATDAAGLATTFTTRQDDLLAAPQDAEAVRRYIAAHAHPGDLVLASPTIAWMFDRPEAQLATRGADLLQTVVQSGKEAAFYPAGLPASRWVYDVSLGSARYVVVDDLLLRLASPDQLPALFPVLQQVERWPVAFTVGHYTVYERPGNG